MGTMTFSGSVIALIALISLTSGLVFVVLDPKPALVAAIALDSVMLFGVAKYALKSEKHWPLWFSGFHATTVFFEVATLILPQNVQMLTWRMGSFWFIPAYFSMAIGLLLDERSCRPARH